MVKHFVLIFITLAVSEAINHSRQAGHGFELYDGREPVTGRFQRPARFQSEVLSFSKHVNDITYLLSLISSIHN